MIWALLWLAQAAAADPAVSRGEKLFAQNCSVGYCHGVAGAASRGPRLRGRSFDKQYLYNVTRDGIPRTAMPGWKDRLKDEEIWAVVAYIQSLSGETGAETVGELSITGALITGSARQPAAASMRGQAAFAEHCGTCHSVGGRGTAIGPDLTRAAPKSLDAGQPLELRHVRTIKLKDGEAFPAILLERDAAFVTVYDLTVPPPVRRTLEAAEVVSISDNPAWKHPAPPAQLAEIVAYVRAATAGAPK